MAEELTPEEIQEKETAERDAQWDDVENEVFGDGVTVPPEKEPKKEEPPVEIPEEVPIVDPWEGINPALKEEFNALKTKAGQYDTLETRLKQTESRIGSVTNKLHEAEEAQKKALEEKENAPTEKEIAAAAETATKWEELKVDYPEWADAMDNRFAAEQVKLDEGLTTIKELKEEIEALKIKPDDGEIEKKVKAESAKTLVSLIHPDWKETVTSDDWKTWLLAQSEDVKKKSGSFNVRDAVEVLDLFKDRNTNVKRTPSQIAEERRKRLLNSELPSKGRVRQPVKTVEDMTEDELWDDVALEVWAED